MNDTEQTHRQIHTISNPLSLTARHRRSQRQRISPSPEPKPIATINQPSPLDLPHSLPSPATIGVRIAQTLPAVSSSGNCNSNSFLPDRSKMLNNHPQTPNLIDQQKPRLSDSLNNASGDCDINSSNNSPPSTLLREKNLSTSDLDPFERKKQAALAKVECKLEKAQRLHQSAHQSVEQNISEFLRVTTIPGILNESNSSRITNAAFDKRIRTLQDTKKELEKKIAAYQSDIARIQAGDIPHHFTSSKDILHNIKSKVVSGNSKHRSSNDVSSPIPYEQSSSLHHPESDNHHLQITSLNPNTGSANNNQNGNIHEAIRSSPSNSISNEIGNAHLYVDSNYEYVYDGDKLGRKYDGILPADISAIHDNDKSPLTKRRFTDDSNLEFNDRNSDHSSDDRYVSYNNSKRSTMTTIEYNQLMIKIDFMHKAIDRYETKVTEMQKQIDSLLTINDSQREQNERLNNELTDLTDLHQIEMSSMKTDLKKLENKLLYNFDEYWTEMVEKLDKLDTRTAKVEQTQTHSFETEENTHRVISKLVNILLTVFAIILLLLSTIKNLVQSRVHAVILLILVFIWITIHYLPENYFQTPFFKNFPDIFKRNI